MLIAKKVIMSSMFQSVLFHVICAVVEKTHRLKNVRNLISFNCMILKLFNLSKQAIIFSRIYQITLKVWFSSTTNEYAGTFTTSHPSLSNLDFPPILSFFGVQHSKIHWNFPFSCSSLVKSRNSTFLSFLIDRAMASVIAFLSSNIFFL